jgi:hypothetical protein
VSFELNETSPIHSFIHVHPFCSLRVRAHVLHRIQILGCRGPCPSVQNGRQTPRSMVKNWFPMLTATVQYSTGTGTYRYSVRVSSWGMKPCHIYILWCRIKIEKIMAFQYQLPLRVCQLSNAAAVRAYWYEKLKLDVCLEALSLAYFSDT